MSDFVVPVIRGGQAAFDALVYPPADNRLLTYLNNNIQSAITTTNALSDRFVSTVKNMYDKFNSSAALNASKALLHRVGMHFNQNVIYPVNENSIGSANLIMQQYIMANPTVNHLYEQNRCYGYTDTYFNYEPNTYGKERLDYQRVMTGVLQFDKGGDDGYVVHYSNGDTQDDLHHMDKISILDTWNVVELLIAREIDPTDPDGNTL